MNRTIKLIILFLFSISLFGCGSEDTFSVILMVDNQKYDEIKVATNDEVNLPILTEDGQIFVGWSDNSTTYYDSFSPTTSVTLSAVFESIESVLTYNLVEEDTQSYQVITGYTGEARYLVIPQTIDNVIVKYIGNYSFESSDLIEVSIPRDALIGDYAFRNSLSLKEVNYYGDYLIPYTKVINQEEYNDILNDYPSCEIQSGSTTELPMVFSEGCPIMEVTEVKSLLIGGAVYTNYTSLINRNIMNVDFIMAFGLTPFDGSLNLHSIEIPNGVFFIPSMIIGNCPSLTNILLEETNTHYKSVNGVVFSYDMKRLIYYPNGLQDESFTIPDALTDISTDAFEYNTSIKSLTIPSSYNGAFNVVGLLGLESIEVESGNERYSTLDGVLYSGSTLIKYPANKLLTNFTVPENVSEIGDYAFYDNQNLVNIDLSLVTKVGAYAFFQTKNIVELRIPSSVLTLEMYFIGKSNVQTLILERSLEVDNSLTTLLVGLGPIDALEFQIVVPDSDYENYTNLDNWSYYDDFMIKTSDVTNP